VARALRDFGWLGLSGLLAGLLAGCLGPEIVDLPDEPDGVARRAARDQRAPTAARVVFTSQEEASSLELDRSSGRAFARYRILVGEAVCASLAELAAAAIDGDSGGETLAIRVLELQADCSLGEQQVASVLKVHLEVELPGALPIRVRLNGSGVDAGPRPWTLSTPERIREAFAEARGKVEDSFLRFLDGLSLPAAGPPRPGPAPADASHEAPAPHPYDLAPQPLPEPHRSQGLALERVDELLALGDLQAALVAASEWTHDSPTEALAYQRRGAIRLMLGDFDAAMADCYRALELEPDSAPAYVTRASVYLERGELDRARSDCATAGALPKTGAVEAALGRLRDRIEGE
jgi:tetratricopeptide (TPR) repeat protein